MNEPASTLTAAPQRSSLSAADYALAIAAVVEVVLILATQPLWFGDCEFPRVPVFDLGFGDWIGISSSVLVAMCAVIVGQTCRGRRPGKSTLLITLAAGLLAVNHNLHRLQPWHWLFLLWIAQSLLVGDRRQDLFRFTIGTIYVFASLSRVAPNVEGGMTFQVLEAARAMFGVDGQLSDRAALTMCSAMTAIELAIGLGLLFGRTMRLAAFGSIAMHLALLLLLGPWGLDHQAAVLVWNSMFVVVVPLLSWTKQPAPVKSFQVPDRAVQAVLLAFPALGLFGLFDNWPAWQLYSPRPDVVRVFVSPDSIERLPGHVSAFIEDSTLIPLEGKLQEWRPIRIDRWSLQATGAPLYPEDRFQLAVARALVSPTIADDNVLIQIESAATPGWWHRQVRTNKE